MEEVQRRLSELRAGDLGNEELRVVVRIEEQVDHFRLSLDTELGGRAGQRQLRGQTCEDVTRAAIAVLLLLLDAESAQRSTPAPASITPKPLPAPSRKPKGTEPDRRRKVDVVLASALSVGHGVLPGTALAFEARAGVRWRAVRVEALAQLWPERTAHPRSLPAAGAEFSMVALGFLVCPELFRRPVGGRLCGGAEAEWVHGRGFGVDEPDSASTLGTALVFGAGLSVPIAHGLAIGWTLEGVIPTARPRFVLDNVGSVFQRPRLGGRTALGLELAF